jgi:DNA-binding beta-propeller fold protein YncE
MKLLTDHGGPGAPRGLGAGQRRFAGFGTHRSRLVARPLCAAALLAAASSWTTPRDFSAGVLVHPPAAVPTPPGLISGARPQPDGLVWVLEGSARAKTMAEVNMTNSKLVRLVPVSASASSISQSSRGELALGLATSTAGAVELRSGSTGGLVATVPVGAPVRSVTFGLNPTALYVLNGTAASASITVVNTSTGKATGSVGVQKAANSVVVSADQASVFTVTGSGSMQQTSLRSGKAMTVYSVGAGPAALAISPGGGLLYVLKEVPHQIWEIAVVDAATRGFVRVLPAPAHSLDLAISADGGTLYDLVGAASVGNIQALRLPADAR